jgi:hypothetical protein
MNDSAACCLERPNVERFSLWNAWQQEADQFKWLESEKAGRDLGESALKRWVKEHWWGFLRARWIEHLQGSRFWVELDQDDFGLIVREFRDDRALLNQILAFLKDGKENLDILRWARDNDIPCKPVIDILERLDINGHRLIHHFDAA